MALPIFLAGNTTSGRSTPGTATSREHTALPPAALFEAALEDVSRAGAPAETIARTRAASPGIPLIAFTIASDRARILPDHRYVVRASLFLSLMADGGIYEFEPVTKAKP